ncbi:MAG: RidA family protein [Planctomycetota bacterium]
MTRSHMSSGSEFEKHAAYSRAVVDGDDIFVSGTTGYDYASMTIEDDVVAQCRQTFRNIESALAKADATLADVVRVTYILPNPEDFEPCWPVLREYFGSVRPAATMFAAKLINPSIKIEIEVTARRRR